jgi:hypothetical protein
MCQEKKLHQGYFIKRFKYDTCVLLAVCQANKNEDLYICRERLFVGASVLISAGNDEKEQLTVLYGWI